MTHRSAHTHPARPGKSSRRGEQNNGKMLQNRRAGNHSRCVRLVDLLPRTKGYSLNSRHCKSQASLCKIQAICTEQQTKIQEREVRKISKWQEDEQKQWQGRIEAWEVTNSCHPDQTAELTARVTWIQRYLEFNLFTPPRIDVIQTPP